jgi:hypothetical protein
MPNLIRYLIQEGHVCMAEVEFDLAHLCLTYLSLGQLAPQADDSTIRASLNHGLYAFLDYASCFWAQHLTISIRDMHTIRSRSSEDLIVAIDALLAVQWASPQGTLTVSKTLAQSLATLSSEDSYDSLCQAIVSNANQLLRSGKGPSNDEPLHLAKVVATVRKSLEDLMSTSGSVKPELQKFYGTDIFKCDRLNCHYYSNGFFNKSQRDAHSLKHERPFPCKEEGCPQAVIGCVSAKDLQKHMVEYHGTADAVDPDYPEDPPPDAPAPKTQKNPATFQCPQCPKRLTRAQNLRQHLLTHTNEKPFECPTCQKRFARLPDLKRHVGLHTGEKKFHCSGELKNGGTWGCGRLFPRADALGRHLKNGTGRVCIRPLIEEQAQERSDQSALTEFQVPAQGPISSLPPDPVTGDISESWTAYSPPPLRATSPLDQIERGDVFLRSGSDHVFLRSGSDHMFLPIGIDMVFKK